MLKVLKSARAVIFTKYAKWDFSGKISAVHGIYNWRKFALRVHGGKRTWLHKVEAFCT